MNANDLITTTARRLSLTDEECSAGAKALAEYFSQIFTDAGSLHIPGFGCFRVEKHDETVRLDKFSGERILMPPRLDLAFTYNSEEQGILKDMPENLESNLVEEIFRTAREALERDRYVRLPDIGLFKQTDHEVLFTPDRQLREKVNSPFAYFSEEVLSEGVMFEDEIHRPSPRETKQDINNKTSETKEEKGTVEKENTYRLETIEKDQTIKELQRKLDNEQRKNRQLGALCAILTAITCGAIILML